MILSLLLIPSNNILIPLRKLYSTPSCDSTMKIQNRQGLLVSHPSTCKELTFLSLLTSKPWQPKPTPACLRPNLLCSSLRFYLRHKATLMILVKRVKAKGLMEAAMDTLINTPGYPSLPSR
jgi:hypothetical protein